MEFTQAILSMISLAFAYAASRIRNTTLSKVLWVVSFITLVVLILL